MTAADRIRGQLLRRTPTSLLLLGGLVLALAATVRWAAARPALPATATAAGALWWIVATGRWWWLCAAAGAACLTLGAIMELRPPWWQHLTATLASRRRRRWYARRWDLAIRGAGLEGVDEMPSLLAHRFAGLPHERDTDVLTVRMAAGQLVGDWRTAQVRLAGTFELQRLRAHAVPGCPRDVQLYGRRTSARPSTAVEPTVDDDPQPTAGAFPRAPRNR